MITQELAIFDNPSSVVKLDGDRGPIGINILAVYIPADGRQVDINLNATYSDLLQWGLFGWAARLSICDLRIAT